MSNTSEFYSLYPLLGTKTAKLKQGQKKSAYQFFDFISSNTNNKESGTRDKLKTLFRDRTGNKSLSEQKVDIWLSRNQTFYDSIPKDLTDIPEAIWAPPDGTSTMYSPTIEQEPDEEVENQTGNNTRSQEPIFRDTVLYIENDELLNTNCLQRSSRNLSAKTARMTSVLVDKSQRLNCINGISTPEKTSQNNSKLSTNVHVDGRHYNRNHSVSSRGPAPLSDIQVPYFFHPPSRRFSSNHDSLKKKHRPLKVNHNQV